MAALGAALDIMFMMAINLVGFSVGLGGVQEYVATAFFSAESAKFFVMTIFSFYAAAQFMFNIRAREARLNLQKEF